MLVRTLVGAGLLSVAAYAFVQAFGFAFLFVCAPLLASSAIFLALSRTKAPGFLAAGPQGAPWFHSALSGMSLRAGR